MSPPLERFCATCAENALVRREPIYEGFRKTGERQFCALCGHEFPDGEEPAVETAAPALFGPEDLPATPRVFDDEERGRCCRYCRHYVVNPFRQWCGRRRREVEATDYCDDFSPPSPTPPTAGEPTR